MKSFDMRFSCRIKLTEYLETTMTSVLPLRQTTPRCLWKVPFRWGIKDIWFAATSWKYIRWDRGGGQLWDSFYSSRLIMFGKRALAINTGNIISYEWGKQQMAEQLSSQSFSAHEQRLDCHCWYTGLGQRQTGGDVRSSPPSTALKWDTSFAAAQLKSRCCKASPNSYS